MRQPSRGHCATWKCGVALKPFARIKLCPSCRWAWGWGTAIGGFVVAGIIKLAEHFLK